MKILKYNSSVHPHVQPPIVRSMGCILTLLGTVLVFTSIGEPAAQSPGALERGATMGEYLRDLEKRFEESRETYGERLRDFRRDFEKERERFWEENEEYRRDGQRALESFTEDIHRFLEERGVDIQHRFEELEQMIQEQGEAWFDQWEAWEKDVAAEGHPPAEPEQPEAEEHAPPMEFRLYVVARGLPWIESGIRSDVLEVVSDTLDAPAESLSLLDALYVRTAVGKPFSNNGHLGDGPEGRPQPYFVAVEQLTLPEPERILLEGLRFETHIFRGESEERRVQMEVSTSLAPGRPTVLGTTSLRGADHAIALVAIASPVD